MKMISNKFNIVAFGAIVLCIPSFIIASSSSFIDDKINTIMAGIEQAELQFQLTDTQKIEYYQTIKSIYSGVITRVDQKLEVLQSNVQTGVTPPSSIIVTDGTIIDAAKFRENNGLIADTSGFLGWVAPGDWLSYSLNFQTSINAIDVEVALPDTHADLGNVLEIRLDSPNGKIIGTKQITPTGGWYSAQFQTILLSEPLSSEKMIYIVAQGTQEGLWNLRSMRFYKVSNTSTPGTVTPKQYTLSVNPPVGGMVMGPNGLSCPGVCSMNYDANTQVSFSIMTNPGYSFVGWSGDCSGNANACTVTLTSPKSIGANFQVVQTNTNNGQNTSGQNTSGMSMTGMTYVNPTLIPNAQGGSSTADVQTTGEMPTPTGDNVGAFRNVCQYSHMNFDDAIVFPGTKNATHLHTYWGNTSVNANTTSDSLITTGNSTCRGGIINRSAYWAPAMIDTQANGKPIAPKFINVYYKSGYGGVEASTIKPWPKGFRMLAGNAKSTDRQDNIVYVCNGDWATHYDFIPDNCYGYLEVRVFFPQCWDGKNLDSPDHKSHVAFPDGGCPSTHPIPTPELSYHIIYDAPNGTAGWRLSSDKVDAPAGSSGHGDWMDGWDQDIMNTWVKNVVNTGQSGGSHMLGDGRVMTCNFPGCF